MIIKGFTLENQNKINRVIQGNLGRDGAMEGGLGEGADEDAILAEYDRMGGYITKDGMAIKTGSFYDFKNRKAFDKPKPIYIFNIGGEKIEVDDPSKLASAIHNVEVAKAEAKAEDTETTSDTVPMGGKKLKKKAK